MLLEDDFNITLADSKLSLPQLSGQIISPNSIRAALSKNTYINDLEDHIDVNIVTDSYTLSKVKYS